MKNYLIIAVIVVIAYYFLIYKSKENKNKTTTTQTQTPATKMASFDGGGGGGYFAAPAHDVSQLVPTLPIAPYMGLFGGAYSSNQMLPPLQMGSTPNVLAPNVTQNTQLSYQTGPSVSSPVSITNNDNTAKTIKAGTPVSYNSPELV